RTDHYKHERQQNRQERSQTIDGRGDSERRRQGRSLDEQASDPNTVQPSQPNKTNQYRKRSGEQNKAQVFDEVAKEYLLRMPANRLENCNFLRPLLQANA